MLLARTPAGDWSLHQLVRGFFKRGEIFMIFLAHAQTGIYAHFVIRTMLVLCSRFEHVRARFAGLEKRMQLRHHRVAFLPSFYNRNGELSFNLCR